MTLEELERIKAEEALKAKAQAERDEQNYIKWLRDIKPKWTEEQILHSAGRHFNKNFLKKEEEVLPDETWTHENLDIYIDLHELDIDKGLKKADKLKAIKNGYMG